MANSCSLKSKKTVKDIFAEMEYRFIEESPTLAVKWIEINHKWIDTTVRYCGKTAEFPSLSKVEFVSSGDSKLNYSKTGNKEWLETDRFHRVQVLQRLADLLEQNSLLFGQLDAMERCLPLHNILEYDVAYFVRYFQRSSFMPLQISKFVKKMDLSEDCIDCVQITRFFSLYEICWNISPYLICGQTVKLAVDSNSVLLTLLFIKLCLEAGIPEDVLRLESIRSSNENSICYGQSTAVIFDGVDLDSVVDLVIEGAWNHHGLLPWSIKRILVQEPIFDVFIEKLSKEMQKLKFGSVFNRLTSFSKPLNSKILTDLKAIVSEADSEGLKVLQVGGGSNEEYITPSIIIGRPQCLFENNSLLPVVTTESFRTLEESIKLLKNSHFLTSASLWTNNHSVLQKATLLLMRETGTQTVWLNTHSILDPSVPFSFQNISHGIKEDLLSYLFKKSFPGVTLLFNPKTPDIVTRLDGKDLDIGQIEDILSAASKSQAIWHKFGPLKRMSVIAAVAMKILNQKAQFESYLSYESTEEDQSVESLVEFIIKISSLDQNLKNSSANIAGEDSVIISYRQQGVVLLQLQTVKNIYVFLQLIVSFIASGNSLIIITDEADKINKLYDIFKHDLPLHLVSFINCKCLNTAIVDSEVTPDLEILSANTFICKTAWSVK